MADEWEGQITGASREAPPTTTQTLHLGDGERVRLRGGRWRSVPSGSAPESDAETSGGFRLPGPDLRLIYVCRVTREDLWRQMFLFPPTAVKTEQTEYLVFFLGMI